MQDKPVRDGAEEGLNGQRDASQADIAWVSLVVGLHFVALGPVSRQAFVNWLGGAITVCGAAGRVLVLMAGGDAPVGFVSDVVPGGLLLAADGGARGR